MAVSSSGLHVQALDSVTRPHRGTNILLLLAHQRHSHSALLRPHFFLESASAEPIGTRLSFGNSNSRIQKKVSRKLTSLVRTTDPSYHGLFIAQTIHCTDYFDNIFYFIKAERVQSNHLLLDPKYYVFKQWQNLIVVFHCRFLLPTRFSGN